VAAWKMKENRVLETGRAVTLEYEGRELSVHIGSERDFESVVDEYGQRLVAIVEDARKSSTKAERLPQSNDSGTRQPCGGCLGKNKSLGLLSLGKALLGGRATPELAAQRLAICRSCQAVDPNGTRLFRIVDGKAYCGVPRLSKMTKVYRDEAKWGCGCDLAWKVTLAKADCPHERWPEERNDQ